MSLNYFEKTSNSISKMSTNVDTWSKLLKRFQSIFKKQLNKKKRNLKIDKIEIEKEMLDENKRS